MTENEKKEIIKLVHKTLHGFFEPFLGEERPFTQTENVLLEVNKAICNKIREMPTVEQRPHGEWIPFSERLPEEGKLVLVTLNPISLKYAEHPVIITKYTTEKDSWIHTIPDAVLAWMPLPEPYKEEGEAE